MSDPAEKPPGRGQGQGAVAGHEKSQEERLAALELAVFGPPEETEPEAPPA